jgi:hypothetical protein
MPSFDNSNPVSSWHKNKTTLSCPVHELPFLQDRTGLELTSTMAVKAGNGLCDSNNLLPYFAVAEKNV